MMNLEQVLSFLTNEEKRNNLIYKLKHVGENSEQIHALKNIIRSLNLHKPPPGIEQETILQNTFRYCRPKECFTNFRLVVCKSWQHAVETIRFNRFVSVHKHVHSERFCIKYFKAFKKVHIAFSPELLQNWNFLSPIMMNSMKKLNHIHIDANHDVPQNFELFLLQFLQNSQVTLKFLTFATKKILSTLKHKV
jgi:hypothetical protein